MILLECVDSKVANLELESFTYKLPLPAEVPTVVEVIPLPIFAPEVNVTTLAVINEVTSPISGLVNTFLLFNVFND